MIQLPKLRNNRNRNISLYLVILLLILNLAVILYFRSFYKPSTPTNANSIVEYYEKKNDSLKVVNDSIFKKIQIIENDKKYLIDKIDSLQKRKVVIRKIYIDKYNQVDSSNVNELVNEFEKIFKK